MKGNSLLIGCFFLTMLVRKVEPQFASFSINPQNLPEIKIRQGKQLGSSESLVEIPCNYMVRIDKGVSVSIKSPRYPKNYPVSTYCLRTIVASDNENHLMFSCSSFELEAGSPTCIASDFIRIWGWDPLNSKFFCGNESILPFTSQDPVMNVGFYSNFKYTFSGFSCSVAAVGNDVESIPETFNSEDLQSNSCRCGESSRTNSYTKSGSRKAVTTLEYPWLCAINVVTSPPQNPQICGGTLINSRFLVSSASCLINKVSQDLEVLLGPQNVFSTAEQKKQAPKAEVVNIIMHQNFNVTNLENNIALVELSFPVNFTTDSSIQPICLPSSPHVIRSEGFIAGWQSYPWAPELKDEPLQTTVKIISADICSILMKDFTVENTMICGVNVKTGTCQSDDGGPLMSYFNGTFELIGVASFVRDCQSFSDPAVFTKVSDYLSWIQEITNSESCRIPN